MNQVINNRWQSILTHHLKRDDAIGIIARIVSDAIIVNCDRENMAMIDLVVMIQKIVDAIEFAEARKTRV